MLSRKTKGFILTSDWKQNDGDDGKLEIIVLDENTRLVVNVVHLVPLRIQTVSAYPDYSDIDINGLALSNELGFLYRYAITFERYDMFTEKNAWAIFSTALEMFTKELKIEYKRRYKLNVAAGKIKKRPLIYISRYFADYDSMAPLEVCMVKTGGNEYLEKALSVHHAFSMTDYEKVKDGVYKVSLPKLIYAYYALHSSSTT